MCLCGCLSTRPPVCPSVRPSIHSSSWHIHPISWPWFSYTTFPMWMANVFDVFKLFNTLAYPFQSFLKRHNDKNLNLYFIHVFHHVFKWLTHTYTKNCEKNEKKIMNLLVNTVLNVHSKSPVSGNTYVLLFKVAKISGVLTAQFSTVQCNSLRFSYSLLLFFSLFFGRFEVNSAFGKFFINEISIQNKKKTNPCLTPTLSLSPHISWKSYEK